MCTLTYAPLKEMEYALVSNRDERMDRERAILPVFIKQHTEEVLMPRDPKGNGTWIATGKSGRTVCLLNGAFYSHETRPPYKKSRGLVVREVFDHALTDDFLWSFDPEGIEPFTLIIADRMENEISLTEIRWDEADLHERHPDPGLPHVWSAAKLYPPEVIRDTEKRFEVFLRERNDRPLSTDDLWAFNRQETYQAKLQNARVEPISFLKTLSITSVHATEEGVTHGYEELDTGVRVKTTWPFEGPEETLY